MSYLVLVLGWIVGVMLTYNCAPESLFGVGSKRFKLLGKKEQTLEAHDVPEEKGSSHLSPWPTLWRCEV